MSAREILLLTPCVEVWQTSDLRSLRLGEEKKEDRRKKEGKKLQGKNIMAPLLHRAAIKKCCFHAVVAAQVDNDNDSWLCRSFAS